MPFSILRISLCRRKKKFHPRAWAKISVIYFPQRSFIVSAFILRKRIFLALNSMYMLHNNAAKDQHLNSVCWFFPRVRAWTAENRSQAWQAVASSFLVQQPKMTFPRLAPFAKLNLCSLVPEALKAIWRRNKKFVITSRLWYTAKHRHHVRLRFTSCIDSASKLEAISQGEIPRRAKLMMTICFSCTSVNKVLSRYTRIGYAIRTWKIEMIRRCNGLVGKHRNVRNGLMLSLQVRWCRRLSVDNHWIDERTIRMPRSSANRYWFSIFETRSLKMRSSPLRYANIRLEAELLLLQTSSLQTSVVIVTPQIWIEAIRRKR